MKGIDVKINTDSVSIHTLDLPGMHLGLTPEIVFEPFDGTACSLYMLLL
jgi:hypothetical protein